MKPLLMFACIALLAACGSVPLHESYDPFIGKPVSAVITRLGAPAEHTTLAGLDYYSWHVQRQAGGFTGAMFGGALAFTQRGNCLLTFAVDPKTNLVQSWGSKSIDGKPAACEQGDD